MTRRIPFSTVFPGVRGPHAKDLYLVDGRLAFSPEAGLITKRVIVNSIPKSGTYLFALLLEKLGVVNTRIHILDTHYHDFRGVPLSDVVRAPTDFNVFVPVTQSVHLVREGQFAVGHIGYLPENASALDGFVHLHCIRDLRDVFVSRMRFDLDPRLKEEPKGAWWRDREGPDLFAAYLAARADIFLNTRVLPLANWFRKEGAITFRFEELAGDEGPAGQRRCVETICAKLGLDPPGDILSVLRQEVLGATTRTYTGKRSDYRDYWSEEVDEFFRNRGLHDLNAKLGYKE
jgi:hypothetical protein